MKMSNKDLQLAGLSKELIECRQALAVSSESAEAKQAIVDDLKLANKSLLSQLEAAIASATEATGFIFYCGEIVHIDSSDSCW